MTRPLLGVLAATVLLTLSACGDGDGDNDSRESRTEPTSESPSSPSSETSETTEAGAPGTLSADEIQAKIITGAPPKDLVWLVPTAPSDWTDLEVEQGTRQWQIGDTRCIVTLNQPAGLGTSPTPTSEDVAKDYATSSVKEAGATATLEPTTERLVTNHVNADTVQVQTQFSGVHFTATPGDVEGQAYGYRAGDFALRVVALCGDGQYAANRTAIEGFLESLTAQTTY